MIPTWAPTQVEKLGGKKKFNNHKKDFQTAVLFWRKVVGHAPSPLLWEALYPWMHYEKSVAKDCLPTESLLSKYVQIQQLNELWLREDFLSPPMGREEMFALLSF